MRRIQIEISEEDYIKLKKYVMTIDDMYNTLQGRIYTAIVHGGRVQEEKENDILERSYIGE